MATPLALAVLDAAGVVLSVNPAWQAFAGVHGVADPAAAPGQAYLHLSGALLSPAEAAGLRLMLCRERPEFELAAGFPARAFQVTRLDGGAQLLVSHGAADISGAGTLSEVFDRMSEACFSVDREWRFVAVNTQAEALLQRPAGDLIGENLWQAFPYAVGTEADVVCHRAVRTGQSESFEQYFEPLGGTFQLRAYPGPSGLTVHFQDVSEQKREVQAQLDRNAVLEMTVLNRPLPEILAAVTAMVEARYPGLICTVLLQRHGRLYTAACGSLSVALQRAIDGLEVREDSAVCGVAAFRAAQVVSEDLLADPACRSLWLLLAENQLRSCVSLPILDGAGEVLGTLGLYGRRPGPFPAEVLAELEKARHLAAVATEHSRLSERLAYRARHDALTNLPNRALYAEQLDASTEAAARTGVPMSLLFLDVDRFKGVNDSFGHEVGDQVLLEIAVRLQGAAWPGETLARISGDEFTVILPQGGEDEAVLAAQRFLAVFERPFVAADREVYLGVSIGVAVTPVAGTDGSALRRHADLAMYHAKVRKIGYAVFTPCFNARAFERLQLSSALRRAVENSELVVHYQPQHRLADGLLVCVEALLRWEHPLLGRVSPEVFIPLAEETGLIVPLGAWVLREACFQGARWQAEGRPAVRVAVNVSALQFERDDFVGTVEASLRDSGFPAAALELELTERVVMRDVDASVRRMEALRALGVTLAVDDFGTGFSSLSYLPRLPLNVLKIDRSFVSGLSAGSVNYPVVRAILSLAVSVGLSTVAEGVETASERQVLRALGCVFGQGYLFSRAVPPDELVWPVSTSGAR